MDGARLSKYPHLSWLRFSISCDGAASNPLEVETNGACHAIRLTIDGHHDVRWIADGRETVWHEEPGCVHVFPGDGRDHTFTDTMSADFRAAVVLVPNGHLDSVVGPEGLDGRHTLQRIVAPDDAVLRTALARLVSGDPPDGGFDASHDDVARRLVLRLVQLNGGGMPDWSDDASVFERSVLADVVAFLDGRLRVPPSLPELAHLSGLSPSHFSRKFRRSTGLSVERFINRRRIAAAIPRIKAGDEPLALVAEQLGFATQSHFTRVFSGMTGMTPSRFRRQFKRGAR